MADGKWPTAIRTAVDPDDMPRVRELFQEYATELGVDLCFQGFAEELAGLPGKYAAPQGSLILACFESHAIGCVGVRQLSADCSEMKRLFVRPPFRRSGLGRQLAEAAMSAGRNLGYTTMRLDTLASMTKAVALYESLGFQRTSAYYDNPLPDVLYFEAKLHE